MKHLNVVALVVVLLLSVLTILWPVEASSSKLKLRFNRNGELEVEPPARHHKKKRRAKKARDFQESEDFEEPSRVHKKRTSAYIRDEDGMVVGRRQKQLSQREIPEHMHSPEGIVSRVVKRKPKSKKNLRKRRQDLVEEEQKMKVDKRLKKAQSEKQTAQRSRHRFFD